MTKYIDDGPTVVAAVAEYREGGTSIRKLCAKHGIERGRLHRAIQAVASASEPWVKPPKHVYRTKAQIVAGHRDFLARLAEEE